MGLQDPIQVKVEVPLVSLDVTVTDAQGKSVTTLNQGDFDIFEDGTPQSIKNFSPADSPYSVLILLDCSESTHDRMNLLIASMSRFIDQLRTDDKVAIAAFGSSVHVIYDWNSDRRHKIDFNDDPICKDTDFYGAIDWGVKKLHAVTGRRGMVVFSDGFQTDVARKEAIINGNKVRRVVPPQDDKEFQKVLRKVQSAGTPIYMVAVDTDINPGEEYAGPVPDLQQIRARLEQMTAASGGHMAFPKAPRDVAPLFLQIGRELGTAYSIAYTPPKAASGTTHTIEVRIRGGSYKVQQSRNAYTAIPN